MKTLSEKDTIVALRASSNPCGLNSIHKKAIEDKSPIDFLWSE